MYVSGNRVLDEVHSMCFRLLQSEAHCMVWAQQSWLSHALRYRIDLLSHSVTLFMTVHADCSSLGHVVAT